MIIRLFKESDAEQTAQMISKTLMISNSKDYSKEYIASNVASHSKEVLIERSKESHFYVVCDERIIVGCGGIAGYWGSQSESILLTIFVLPEYQKKGIGRMIIETLENDEYFMRASRIEIPASITACEFYKKFGYTYKNDCTEPDEEGCIRLEKYQEKLILCKPEDCYSEQVMQYREEMFKNKDSFDGCAGLEDVNTYDEWIDFENRLKEKYKEDYIPSDVYLLVRQTDYVVVGIIDFRHPLSDFLFKYGGNIGYCIRPSERRKGYATRMLSLLLPICRGFGEDKVLITCDKKNMASQKTIINNGGVLENEVTDTVGLCNGGIIQRYWITL